MNYNRRVFAIKLQVSNSENDKLQSWKTKSATQRATNVPLPHFVKVYYCTTLLLISCSSVPKNLTLVAFLFVMSEFLTCTCTTKNLTLNITVLCY